MWRGRITTEDEGTSYGRIGTAMVPNRVAMRMVGELGSPDAVLRFEVRQGRPECVESTVVAKADGRGIRTSDVLMINIDALAESAFLDWATAADGSPLGGGHERETWSLRASLEGAIKAPGRGTSRAELETVAQIYRDHPKAPTDAVQKLLGCSRRTAARRVAQARNEGLL